MRGRLYAGRRKPRVVARGQTWDQAALRQIVGVLKAERWEELGPHKGGEWHPGNTLHHSREKDVAGVAIAVAGSRREVEWLGARHVDEVLHGDRIGPVRGVLWAWVVGGPAGSVGQELLERDAVAPGEAGQVLRYVIVEVDPASLRQQLDGGCCKRLRDGADPESRCGADGCFQFVARRPVGALHHTATPASDEHHSAEVSHAHIRFDVGVKSPNEVRSCWMCGLLALSARAKHSIETGEHDDHSEDNDHSHKNALTPGIALCWTSRSGVLAG